MVFIESFNGKFRYELLNGEIFYTLTEVKVLIEQWRNNYNTIRLHSSLGYRPPAPQRQNLRNQRRRILSRRLAVLCRGWALRSFPSYETIVNLILKPLRQDLSPMIAAAISAAESCLGDSLFYAGDGRFALSLHKTARIQTRALSTRCPLNNPCL